MKEKDNTEKRRRMKMSERHSMSSYTVMIAAFVAKVLCRMKRGKDG
jgi:hypothetical protein